MTTMAMPRARKDAPMEGIVAKWYAGNTAEMMKEYVDLAARVATDLPAGSSVLEVAPGPGYFSIELAKRGPYAITGLDLSRTFVELAAKNAARAGVQVKFVQGSASRMPLPKESFDFLLCRAAFKNFAQPVEALREMRRVLRPGGRGVIIDLKGNASPGEINSAVDGMGLTWFNRIMTKLAFRTMLLRRAYTRAQFEAMLTQAGFSETRIVESGIGLEITGVR